jgi:hypothetical protein
MQPFTQPLESVETIAPGITRQWLHNGDIVVLKIEGSTREMVDTYCKLAEDVMANWPAERLYLMVYDFTSPKTMMTPYARERIREMTPLSPDLVGYVAIIVDSRVTALARLMLRVSQRIKLNRQSSLFGNVESGAKWLLQKQAQHKLNVQPQG